MIGQIATFSLIAAVVFGFSAQWVAPMANRHQWTHRIDDYLAKLCYASLAVFVCSVLSFIFKPFIVGGTAIVLFAGAYWFWKRGSKILENATD